MMDARKVQLRKLFDKLPDEQKELNEPIMEKALFLEGQLAELEKLPFYRVHPEHPELQKRTDAGKLYKDLLQAYCNVMKMLNSIVYKTSVEDTDEFDLWEADNA